MSDQPSDIPDVTRTPSGYTPNPRSPGESTPPSWTAPRTIGNFRILSLLGEGGMGSVYLAEDTRLHRRAAVKVMKPELAAKPENRERFLREARAAARVEHDHIVPIYQVGEDEAGAPYIAMPLLQGETLESLLKREGTPPLAVTLKAGREIAAGLAAAHAVGLVHRDVKPANVWVEGDTSAKERSKRVKRFRLLDFGLARTCDSDAAALTSTGAIMGTPAYMAPEQAGGQVDHRCDLFSLGVTLYRMSTGVLPFRGGTVLEVLSSLALTDPPPAREVNPAVPEKLSNLIRKLMVKKRDGRPGSADEVLKSLRLIHKTVCEQKAPSPPRAGAGGEDGNPPRNDRCAVPAWDKPAGASRDGDWVAARYTWVRSLLGVAPSVRWEWVPGAVHRLRASAKRFGRAVTSVGADTPPPPSTPAAVGDWTVMEHLLEEDRVPAGYVDTTSADWKSLLAGGLFLTGFALLAWLYVRGDVGVR